MATILETARQAGSFRTLVSAIEAADLEKTLAGNGPFTVFAPTDAAFAKLPEGTVDELLNNVDDLRKVLTYHVVPGRLRASEVVNRAALPTVQGQDLRVKADDGVWVNDARVTQADVEAENGVIHVIDAVVLPA